MYPVIKNDVMIHASHNAYEKDTRNFPTDNYFVGEVINTFPRTNLLFYLLNKPSLDIFQSNIFNNNLPPIYIINLKDSRGELRRKNIVENVSKHRVNNILVAATDKNQIDGKHHKAKAHKTHGRNLTIGEIALVQSHSELYIALLQSSLPYIIIGEDDICVDATFNTKLQIVLHSLPMDFDIVKLEHCDHNNQKVLNQPNHIQYKNGTELWVHGAGLYIVSRTGATKLLHKNRPDYAWCASDGAMEKCISPKYVYVTLPPLGWQSDDNDILNNGSIEIHREISNL